jgi:hypothetical protein
MHQNLLQQKKTKLGSNSRKGKNQEMTKHKLKRKEKREHIAYP